MDQDRHKGRHKDRHGKPGMGPFSSSGSISCAPGLDTWKFEVDYNDHFETPKVAYLDLLPVLQRTAKECNKELNDLVVYDPYWCQGQMKQHLVSMGITNVINENRDFYKDIKRGQIPEYDILVTNPPYSGEHKVKLFQFLLTNKVAKTTISAPGSTESSSDVVPIKPFAILLPAYTATKRYWRDFERSATFSGSSHSSSPFYIAPPDYYEYCHPEGTGKGQPPFYSVWFVGGLSGAAQHACLRQLSQQPRTRGEGSDGNTPAGPASSAVRGVAAAGLVDGIVRRVPSSVLRYIASVEELVERGYIPPGDDRPSSKARKRLAAKRSARPPPQPVMDGTGLRISVVGGSIGGGSGSKRIVFDTDSGSVVTADAAVCAAQGSRKKQYKDRAKNNKEKNGCQKNLDRVTGGGASNADASPRKKKRF